MIPVRLSIKGMYSYRDTVELDFTKLTEAGLFGIFGPVGSGKSTILEAITYALYGNTERLNSSGDNRNYNMMNLQSREMLVEFEFMTHTSEGMSRYRFRVRQTRNSNKFEDVGSPQRSAYIWENGDWTPLKTASAEGIVGLSYQNFTKTIIIPQGKFQDFLQMGATDRTRMLRELFSLSRFELDVPTKALIRETNERLVRLEEQLKPLVVANEEEIKGKEAELKEVDAALVKEKAQEALLEAAVAHHVQLQTLENNRRQAQAQLDNLLRQEPEFNQRAERLAHFQQTQLLFGELVKRIDALNAEVGAAADLEKATSEGVAQLQQQHIEAKAEAEAARFAYDGKEQLQNERTDWENLRKIRGLADQIAAIEVRLRNGEEKVSEERKKAEQAQSAQTSKEAALAEKRATMPDMSLANAAHRWFNERASLEAQVQTSLGQIQQSQSDLAEILQQERKLAEASGVAHSSELPLGMSLKAKLEEVRKRIETARADRDNLVHQQGLAAFAGDLEAGKPCPLCGAEHHPLPYLDERADQALDAAKLLMQQLEKEAHEVEQEVGAAQSLALKLEAKQAQIQQQETELQERKSAVERHEKAFAFAPYSPAHPEAVAEAIALAEQLGKVIKELESALLKISSDLRAAQTNVEKFTKALESFRDEKSRLQGQRDALQQQIQVLKEADHLAIAPEEMEKRSAALEQRIAEITSQFQKTHDLERNTERALAELGQKLKDATAQHLKLLSDLDTANAEASKRLTENGQADLASVREVLLWQLNTATEQRVIDEFRASVQKAQGALEALNPQGKGETYNAEAHETAKIALQVSKEKSAELTDAASHLRRDLDTLRRDLLKRQTLEAEAEAQRRRHANLKELERLFMASGFVKYVSTIYLQELVARADHRFRQLTRNALSLELGDENEFLVRDMLNGGQTRSVKTLSGGQTFQASLSLALALADNVQQLSGSHHNFFFLDEGFGTLDRDSLQIVFDTLKQLRSENRIVGLISHVDEMQQEIEVYLKVSQTEERGSQVVGSWN